MQNLAVKHYCLMRDKLVFKDGDCVECPFSLIAPDRLLEDILHMNADIHDSGHLGPLRNNFISLERISL